MIPKTIHYCWFGKNKKPKLFYKCLASWKKFCPDFEIIEWNETNSDKYKNVFYKNALRKEKYAFVSDYIRIKVLCEYGGIYLDTDMLLLRNIDCLLKFNFFSGFEEKDRAAYGLFGGVPQNHFFKEMINFYDKNNFDQFDPPIITHTFKKLVRRENLKKNEILYDPEYFYPLTYKNRKKDYELFTTEITFAVHLWNHSWKIEKDQTFSAIFNNIKIIFFDFLFYSYSIKYLFKYFFFFSKEIYYLLKRNYRKL